MLLVCCFLHWFIFTVYPFFTPNTIEKTYHIATHNAHMTHTRKQHPHIHTTHKHEHTRNTHTQTRGNKFRIQISNYKFQILSGK